jgi:hypothetical protein
LHFGGGEGRGGTALTSTALRRFEAFHLHQNKQTSKSALGSADLARRQQVRKDNNGLNTMTARVRLPNRRLAETFEVECAGLRYTATVGRFADGSVAELFLNNHKSNSASDANARDAAIICSLALQNGVPLETIRRALLRDAQDRPSTPLGCALDIIAEAAP